MSEKKGGIVSNCIEVDGYLGPDESVIGHGGHRRTRKADVTIRQNEPLSGNLTPPALGVRDNAPVNGTVFVAIEDLMANPRAAALLERHFGEVRVATSRERALAELVAMGDKVVAAIVGVKERIDADLLASLPSLKVLGSLGAGTDHLDLAALEDCGVRVVTTPGVNAVSVAEHALMMILGLAKRVLPSHAAVLSGRDRAGLSEAPVEVRGRTVGVLGAGATARALLPLLHALGTHVSVWTRRPDQHQDLPTVGLRKLFEESQVVSIHLPLTPQTRGLVDADLLGLLPEGALVVNTARKEIVDLDALRSLSLSRPDLHFAVDDFDLLADGTVEAGGSRTLWSPHIAGVSVEALRAMQETAVLGVVEALRSPS
ncbi:D-isomer specific 2-hydroxyacid dehydrogenase family protein [Streptomyces sp. TBY4]|uniref:NAD(P)-dependent oxidoreductase n=1 Tax=Streptomyces sp. TBY4 TaxID=2962030 RepID=UPI0020B681D0|nr:NAD(P)-dependent oxidoreductase [Streptomyces sp. TBY4]MCP3759534.1 hypothetical protein [Streptomyces sp. TBY4]